jgi:hypothetical protein
MFIAWELVALGGAPAGGPSSADPLQYLAAPPAAVDAFALLAVATSYIGFVLGLSDFFADALAQSGPAFAALPPAARKAAPLLLTLLPPLAAAVTYPDAFFAALEFAAIYGALWVSRHACACADQRAIHFATRQASCRSSGCSRGRWRSRSEQEPQPAARRRRRGYCREAMRRRLRSRCRQAALSLPVRRACLSDQAEAEQRCRCSCASCADA